MARTNISIDQVIYEEFALQASRQKKTLFSFANESLSTISKVSAEGGTPEQLHSLWRVTSIMKEIDVVTLPADFVDELLVKLYGYERDGLFNLFREMGRRLVPLLKTLSEDILGLGEIAKDLALILPVKKIDLKRGPQNSIEVLIIGAGRKIESTGCMAEFIRSILEGYQLRVVKQEVEVGVIRMSAVKRGT